VLDLEWCLTEDGARITAPGTDRVHRDAMAAQGHGKVPAGAVKRSLGRAHADPGLPSSRPTPERRSERENPATLLHIGGGGPPAHEKRSDLGVEGELPLRERKLGRERMLINLF